jgi:hypothetical protein
MIFHNAFNTFEVAIKKSDQSIEQINHFLNHNKFL